MEYFNITEFLLSNGALFNFGLFVVVFSATLTLAILTGLRSSQQQQVSDASHPDRDCIRSIHQDM